MVPQRFHALIAAVGVLGVLVFIAIAVTVKVFYLLTLYRALNRCSPESRAMDPTLVWLNFIPCFSLVWQFFRGDQCSQIAGCRIQEARHRRRGTARAGNRPGHMHSLGPVRHPVCQLPDGSGGAGVLDHLLGEDFRILEKTGRTTAASVMARQ